MRTEEKKEKIRQNRPLTTLKLSLDNYATRPRLQHQIVTDLNWRPSVYLIKKIDKVLLIIDGDEDGTVSLNFYNGAPSYKMDH